MFLVLALELRERLVLAPELGWLVLVLALELAVFQEVELAHEAMELVLALELALHELVVQRLEHHPSCPARDSVLVLV